MLRHVIADHFPADRGARIVDLGCGRGLLVHFARRAGFRDIRGIDLSPQMVEDAQRLDIGGIEQGDALELLAGQAPSSHDAVVSFRM